MDTERAIICKCGRNGATELSGRGRVEIIACDACQNEKESRQRERKMEFRYPSPLDSESIGKSAIDYMIRYAVRHAAQLRSQAQQYTQMAQAATDRPRSDYFLRESMGYQSSAFHVVQPLRYAIKERTALEAESARRRVVECEARFILTSCAEETCSTCDKPLWQHVTTMLARYCPGDGRPYWTLARAIIAADGVPESVIRETLRPIAIDNRSKRAKPARRQ